MLRKSCMLVRKAPLWRAALVALALARQVALAQAPTILAGRVTSIGGDPLASAQVSLVGMAAGASANEQGYYTFTVPASSVRGQTVTLTARRVGYKAESRQITLRSGTTTQNFALQTSLVSLDRVVVTGTPSATRQRELGNTIATVDVEARLKDAPITSVEQLFQGREAGLIGIGAGGETGAGGTILLRGVNSLSQSNQPLVYIDGIRVNQSLNSLINVSGQATNRLNDLNPQDIARVEIIKGASATTLYGSEASGGVIQIFTKRGGAGMEFAVHAETGQNEMPKRIPYQNPNHALPNANDLIQAGLVQDYDLSVRGTANDVAYYSSANFHQDNGSFPQNSLKKLGGRLNMSFAPTPTFSVDLSSQYLYNTTNLPQNGSNGAGILLPILLGDPTKAVPGGDPYNALSYPVSELLQLSANETYSRFLGGLTANHTVTSWLRHRLTVGFDLGNGQGTNYSPFGLVPLSPLGSKAYRFGTTDIANVDYAATAAFTPREWLKTTFSAGAQLASTHTSVTVAAGSNYALPEVDGLSGTAVQSVGETRSQYSTAGAFGQGELGFRDRLFVTAGLRVDGSTSFGSNFGTQKYPKVGLSYVISDEPWFRLPVVSSLKLRSAWGKAGKQPGAFDAVQTFSSVQTGAGTVGIIANNPGNPNLRPEVTTEWEEGFDLGLLQDRVSFNATAYQQRTNDAILTKPQGGSAGFNLINAGLPTNQLINAGSLQNRGVEFGVDATVLQRQNFQWDVNARYAHNSSKVIDLGGLSRIAVEAQAFGTELRPGYPVPSKFQIVSDGYDANGNPTVNGQLVTAATPTVYMGPAIPPNNGSFGTTVKYRAFRLQANTQWATGGVITFFTRSNMTRFRTGEYYYSVLAANGNDVNALPVKYLFNMANGPIRTTGNFTYPGDWLKLREVTLSYDVPTRFTTGHTTSAYVSGRNLGLWTKYPGTDPEVAMAGVAGSGLQVGTEYSSLPQSRLLLGGVNISFSKGGAR